MSLDSRQRAALDDYGWLVLPDVVEPRTLAVMRDAFEHAAETQNVAGAREGGTRHVSLAADSELAVALHEPDVLEAMRHVVARDFGLMNWGGRDPLPGFGQQGLHADWRPRAAWEPFHAATALWLLDDFTSDNGATRLVPASHRKGAVPKAFTDPERHHPEEKLVIARAGSVLVFNGHLWHSGTRNRSNRSRRVVQCQFAAKEWLLRAL
jgi:ectoine hydroxylase-related dioxygenase (phytanoyl-CoA dioxygenase family)